jgi:hypothetical protein
MFTEKALTRRQKRMLNRRRQREERRDATVGHYDCFEQITNLDHIAQAQKDCSKGTRWKCSVQKYCYDSLSHALETKKALKEKKDVRKGFVEFSLYERGKLRRIYAVHISERVPQRTLCRYVLMPIINRSLVSSNCASIKGKGELYAEDLLSRMLSAFYQKYRDNHGYIVMIDVHDYFGQIDREDVKSQMFHMIHDPGLQWVISLFIDAFATIPVFSEHGVGLGSEVSQNCGILALNQIDHKIKEYMNIGDGGKRMARYMDDSYNIQRRYEDAVAARTAIMQMYTDKGYPLNPDKCQIYPIWKPFTWLKKRYHLTASGKVVRKVGRESIKRNRKSFKLGRKWVNTGKYSYQKYENICRSVIIGMQKHYNSTASNRALQTLFCYEFYCLLEESKAPYIQELQKILKTNYNRPKVTLVRVGLSYMAWGKDAIVTAKICAVKLRSMKRGTKIVAFDEKKLPKYLGMLKQAKVSYEVYKVNKKDMPQICQQGPKNGSNYYQYI